MNMKKSLHRAVSLGIILVGLSAFTMIKNTGTGGYVGSPGENTCTQCHAASSSVSGTSIIATPAFTANQYVPGQTYTIQIGVGSLTLGNFGFACEILNSANTDAGIMQNPQSGVSFSVAANGRKNATQNIKKAGTGFATFQFEWVAPSSGQVKIYAAGNAVNSNNLATGDAVSTASLALTAAGVGIQEKNQALSSLQIYPNPVRSDFRFSYHLTESGVLKVALFDLQGKEVTEFVHENQQNGLHTMNASLPADLNKGVYFLKFSYNGKPATQRMIITQ